MDKTNKITITCADEEERVRIAMKVAELLGIHMLDIDDYIVRGSVATGDLEQPLKSEFIEKFGESLFDALETISYIAYTKDVKEPMVLSVGNDRNEGNVEPFRKTISINVSRNDRDMSSLLSDYSVKSQKSITSTAKKIVKLVAADERWSRDL